MKPLIFKNEFFLNIFGNPCYSNLKIKLPSFTQLLSVYYIVGNKIKSAQHDLY